MNKINQKKILEKTSDYVKKMLEKDSSGHDWWHTHRVWKMALKIAREEGNVDLFVVQLAALLHDIGDWKFCGGNDSVGPKLAKNWLEKLELEENTITQICEIIKEMSFKGAGVKSRMKTKEGMVVQDADRLDAIGAIGIARTFAYGGYKGKKIYDPKIKPEKHESFEQYKSSKSPTINHFYEKLLLLRDLMNTKTAKRIAKERHEFMVEFLDRFFKEWDGKS